MSREVVLSLFDFKAHHSKHIFYRIQYAWYSITGKCIFVLKISKHYEISNGIYRAVSKVALNGMGTSTQTLKYSDTSVTVDHRNDYCIHFCINYSQKI